MQYHAKITETILRINAVVKNLDYMFGKGANGVTPFDLCLELADKTIDFNNFDQKIIDPTCGKGSFLLAVIKRFIEAGCPVDHAVNMVYGVDNDQSQVDHARVNIQRATGVSAQIECADSLTKEFNMKFDVIVGNPPYNDSNNGNIPIYGDFVKKSLEMSDRISLIIPSAFALSNERSGDEIRKMVFGPHTKQIAFLPQDTFENVDVETLLVTIDKTKRHDTEVVSRYGDSYITDTYNYIFEDKVLYNILTKCNVGNSRESWIKFNRMEYSKKTQNKVKTLTCINSTGKTYEETNTVDKFLGNHRVVTSFFQDPDFRHYLTYAIGPDISVKDGYTVSLCHSESEAHNLVTFIKTKLFLAIYKKTRTSRTLRSPQLKFIPKVDLTKTWTDQELYAHFNLTQEEIDYVERSAT